MISQYRLLGNYVESFQPKNLPAFTPTITPRDIANGEITRYFCRQVNRRSHEDIREISPEMAVRIRNDRWYQVIEIRWKITGRLDSERGLTPDGDPVILRVGVVEANRRSVMLAEEEMPGIKYLFQNYQRFWQDE
jgi:hypothetical protein